MSFGMANNACNVRPRLYLQEQVDQIILNLKPKRRHVSILQHPNK